MTQVSRDEKPHEQQRSSLRRESVLRSHNRSVDAGDRIGRSANAWRRHVPARQPSASDRATVCRRRRYSWIDRRVVGQARLAQSRACISRTRRQCDHRRVRSDGWQMRRLMRLHVDGRGNNNADRIADWIWRLRQRRQSPHRALCARHTRQRTFAELIFLVQTTRFDLWLTVGAVFSDWRGRRGIPSGFAALGGAALRTFDFAARRRARVTSHHP